MARLVVSLRKSDGDDWLQQLINGEDPAAHLATPARATVRTHVARNPGGHGVHLVHEHQRATQGRKAKKAKKPKPAPPVDTGGEEWTTWVPATKLDVLQKRIDALARRAQRLKVQPPHMSTTGNTRLERRVLPETAFEAAIDLGTEAMVEVKVVGPMVRLPGWRLAGILEPQGKGKRPLLTKLSEEMPPARYRRHSTGCEHCKSNRRRTRLFLVHQPSSNTWKRVGGECARDFTGRTAQQLVPVSDLLKNFRDDFEAHLPKSGPAEWNIAPAAVLQIAAWVVADGGFVSSKMARETGMPSTAALVRDYIERRAAGQAVEKPANLAKHAATATKVLDWLKGMRDTEWSSYLDRLRTVATAETASYGNVPLLVSAISAYHRANEKARREKRERRRRAKLPGGGVLGSPGDKFRPAGTKVSAADRRKGVSYHPPMALRVTSTKVVPTQYGITNFVTLEDIDGRTYLWRASNRTNVVNDFKVGEREHTSIEPIEPGARFIITGGTIKQHSEWRGVPRTELTRCKLIPVQTRSEVMDLTHLPRAARVAWWKNVRDTKAGVRVMRKGRLVLRGED